MMRVIEDIPIRLNLVIDLLYSDGRVAEHHCSHNIVTNTGRQFMAEVITASSFSGPSFVRTNNEVVRYIGFGIGGSRQTAASPAVPPLSVSYPGATPGTQTDMDVTVSIVERPVQVTADPLWMREISTPGTFPLATSTRYLATFSQSDINFGSFLSVPLSEIGLYKSSADPSLPNGLGSYPGTASHLIAYDTFNPIEKTGLFAIGVRWEWRF